MTDKPLVSVVIATYHRREELERALLSLAGQSYPCLEIILVDDNADKDWNATTTQIVSRIQEQVGLAVRHIINAQNKGSAATRNIGIEAAKGEYITFLDDDDEYLPSKVELQLQAMLQSGADYSITDLNLFNEHDRQIESRTRDYICATDEESLFEYHLMYHMTGTDTLMFRTDYLRKIGGFPPIDVGDEFYLMAQAIKGGGAICYVPGCHVKAYVHAGEGGLSSGESKIRGENTLYEYKHKYMFQISVRSRRYIRMRHFAVLAFAYLRQKRFVYFFINGVKAFIAAPLACIRLLTKGR